MKHKMIIIVSVLLTMIFSVRADAGQLIIMEIEGMTCQLCPLAVRKSLSAVEGVNSVKVSYENAKAWIIVTESIEDQVLIDAVSRAGPYKGQILERKPINKP